MSDKLLSKLFVGLEMGHSNTMEDLQMVLKFSEEEKSFLMEKKRNTETGLITISRLYTRTKLIFRHTLLSYSVPVKAEIYS